MLRYLNFIGQFIFAEIALCNIAISRQIRVVPSYCFVLLVPLGFLIDATSNRQYICLIIQQDFSIFRRKKINLKCKIKLPVNIINMDTVSFEKSADFSTLLTLVPISIVTNHHALQDTQGPASSAQHLDHANLVRTDHFLTG